MARDSNAQRGRVMLLTPAGAAAIAVVRLRGEGVENFLHRHFSQRATPGRCVHGELRDGEQVLDDIVVVLSEDHRTAELNVHGGAWVINSVIELARREGFEPIEHTQGALDPRMVDATTIVEQEMLTHLPLARSREALAILLEQPALWERWERGELDVDLNATLNDRGLWWMLHPPTVAIVGAANVGKSTLANQLFAQDRSITADVPGTTRDWVGEMANLDGLAVTLVDTPGVRETVDPIERQAIERSGAQVTAADLVVMVLDASREEADQRRFLGKFPEAVVVLNKVEQRLGWTVAGAIETVATQGRGVQDLRRAIRQRFQCENLEPGKLRWWTSRQREELRRRLNR